jgi:hypothetical protein
MWKKCCAVIGLAVNFALPLSAQNMPCGPRDAVVQMLAAQDQTRRAIGLSGRAIMEVFAASDGARWTITVTMADGRMCLLANGVAFDATPAESSIQGTAL